MDSIRGILDSMSYLIGGSYPRTTLLVEDVQPLPPPSTFAHAKRFVWRVRDRLGDRPEDYLQFIESLDRYENEHLPMHVAYREICVALSVPGDEELLRDFLRFFPTSWCFGLPHELTGAWRRSHKGIHSPLIYEQDHSQAQQEGSIAAKLQADLAVALHNGSPPCNNQQRRAGLPMEIVLKIMRYSFMVAPSPVGILKTTPLALPAGATGRMSVRAKDDGTDTWKLVCASEPLDRVALAKMATLQIVTLSQDQGWTSHAQEGSQSWFELGIFQPSPADSESPPRRAWVSHHNKIAGEDVQEHVGIEFGVTHHLWEELEAGDCLGVWAHAKHQGWQCHVAAVELRFRQWFGTEENHIAHEYRYQDT